MGHRLELGIRLLRSGQSDAAIIELQAAHTIRGNADAPCSFSGIASRAGKTGGWPTQLRRSLAGAPANDETRAKELLFLLCSGAAEAGDLNKAIELGYDLANMDFAYRDIGKLLDDWQAKLQQA